MMLKLCMHQLQLRPLKHLQQPPPLPHQLPLPASNSSSEFRLGFLRSRWHQINWGQININLASLINIDLTPFVYRLRSL
jgi:hypothetical protein